ncbi:Ras- protein Rab-28 [Chytriomyces hyalinus]|nr:Ras- protein Rab-28 [Chytriomyces hyalinus]
MEIWDVGGQTLTSKTATNYIHAVHAIAFVYDASRPGSLRTLEDWVQLVLGCKIITDTVLPLFVLVQTKNDISNAVSSRPESRMQHQRFANEHNLPSFSVSAKSGDGVAELFRGIALDLCGVYRLRRSDVDQAESYDVGGAERMTVVGAGRAGGSSANVNDFSAAAAKGQLADKEKAGCSVM